MKRGGPLKPGKPLTRKTPTKKRKLKDLTLADVKRAFRKVMGPLKRAKAAVRRLDQFGPPGFVEFVHQHGCVVARQSGSREGCLGPIEAAHVRPRGNGGGWRDNVVGLCTVHHSEQHTIGIKTFAARHDLDLDLWACAITGAFERSRDGW